jgi:hypothetical protein
MAYDIHSATADGAIGGPSKMIGPRRFQYGAEIAAFGLINSIANGVLGSREPARIKLCLSPLGGVALSSTFKRNLLSRPRRDANRAGECAC